MAVVGILVTYGGQTAQGGRNGLDVSVEFGESDESKSSSEELGHSPHGIWSSRS